MSQNPTDAGTLALPFDLLTGVVVDFDADRGLGRLRPDGDDGLVVFHCTAIADGTRRIDAGSVVAFVIGPAGPGRWEAISIRPLGPARSPD